MKVTQLLRTTAVAAAAIFALGTAEAQSPSEQLGLGVTTGSTFGGTVSYAITPAIHVGTLFGFSSFSPKVGNTVSTYSFAPYGRFLFAGSPVLKPIIQAQFDLASVETINPATFQTETKAQNTLIISGGGEYFVNRNLGIYAMISVIELGLSDQGTAFGILTPQIGVEWFF
ncbi:MAG: hypothetical protein V4642_09015 [Bacteroidota bacterium]